MSEYRFYRQRVYHFLRSAAVGTGQVMFQENALSGLVFIIGIFWGAFESGRPEIALGALAGVIAANIAGMMMNRDHADGHSGLWGFNGLLIGCALPVFLVGNWQMWIALVLIAMLSVRVRTALDNVMSSWDLGSLTIPFVLLTWIVLSASHSMAALAPAGSHTVNAGFPLDLSLPALATYWLRGISQVFLIESPVTGALFVIGLALCSLRAALWAMVGSAVAIVTALCFGADPNGIAAGLYGFSPVLTAVALGSAFRQSAGISVLQTLAAIVVTVFVQAGMDAVLAPLGIPALTAPFCVTTWLFLLMSVRTR